MRQPVQQFRSHLGIARDLRPFGKAQIGRDHNAGTLVDFGWQVKQQHAACLAVHPMREQPRIIVLLQERREQLEKLRHYLDEHIARLREYRFSLISVAVTGQLTFNELDVTE